MSDDIAGGIGALAMIVVFITVVMPALKDVTGVIQFDSLFTLAFIMLAVAIVATMIRGR